ncbi:excinuclease ABC subunit UvrC [Clostridium perfringens]|uniref:UvrABC system protein C n=3 Tax=Clostridium perfringens TaxID=1502 RepID=UVRC_CLOP1|nr:MULTISPECIES: excinuclease ABC subunit UvrC [Clostridium]Q0TU89.1 RecName: Full=UvrABC system protein C; Short=Protein UvrC; AltName: Full=Excinuclease ABC subunit C [Clostridium perfringens ATCC 13124]ABG83959.1 excinuclease ABC, C subunit [Clostridium perfringens ATCC 13124]EDT23709.1 excinuclease ABC, C subunit [Clostridium perfringens B str. ATCC 3626]EGT0683848.1 excinuclease ABC subunit UvrC [Clostridium perfringens]EGT0685519.1 excinuclease ABC subunit UvrC [Clostridium perfringens]
MFDFQHQLKILPDKPGVYIMKNSLGEVIYVGKAKVLKNRVRQYFQNSKNHSEKVRAMVKNIAEFEYIVTDSEMEALILECNLIKKYSPRYNIALKDDKFYPFIKITTNEDFPRVYVTRNFAKDGNRYFGPYTNGTAVYEVMGLIKKLFPLRTCKKAIVEGGEPTRACLNYHINLCKAPCAGYISKAEYWEMIDEIINILNGTDTSIIKKLKLEMEKAAEELEFEKAAKIRDRILAIELISEKQKMFTVKEGDEDFIDLYTDEKDGCAQVFFVREGKVTGREHFMIENISDDPVKEVISSFIASFYGGTAQIPKTIYVPEEIEDQELIEKFLTEKRGSKVWIKVPKKGDKKNLLDMVRNNAKIMLDQFKEKMVEEKELNKSALTELADVLGLDSLPARIEAYDISNIQGVDSVGTMVVFENGKAKNSDYRRFKIKSVKGPNDYESMREILSRRFSHGLEEVNKIKERNLEYSKGKFCIFPDLIMMDGGKGQVNIALEVLKDFGIEIPVCGLVKDHKHRTRGIIFNNEEILIRRGSGLMNLITRVQDEVHRYAITYHRSLRDKRTLHSILEDIPRIGEKRRRNLLMKFGSIDNIKKASMEELLDTPGIDKRAAESIKQYFSS